MSKLHTGVQAAYIKLAVHLGANVARQQQDVGFDVVTFYRVARRHASFFNWPWPLSQQWQP